MIPDDDWQCRAHPYVEISSSSCLVFDLLYVVPNGPIMRPDWHWHILMDIAWFRVQRMMVILKMIREDLYSLLDPQRWREIVPRHPPSPWESDVGHLEHGSWTLRHFEAVLEVSPSDLVLIMMTWHFICPSHTVLWHLLLKNKMTSWMCRTLTQTCGHLLHYFFVLSYGVGL